MAAMSLAADTLAARSRTAYVAPANLARTYPFAGKKDQVLDWLEKACGARDPNMLQISVFPPFDFLRDEPRFRNLRRRMNLPL